MNWRRSAGMLTIASLIDGLPDRPSIESYVRIVREKSALRQIIHACNATVARAQDGQAEAITVVLDKRLKQSGECASVDGGVQAAVVVEIDGCVPQVAGYCRPKIASFSRPFQIGPEPVNVYEVVMARRRELMNAK